MGFGKWFRKNVLDDLVGIDVPTPPPAVNIPDPTPVIQQELSKQTDLLRQQQADAQKAASDALDAQKAATAQAEAAMIPQSDNESVRRARDDRARTLKQSSPFGIGLQKKLGSAPVGFRVLSGS